MSYTEDSLPRFVIYSHGDLRLRGRGALPEIALGRCVAADRLAAWHALLAVRLSASAARSGYRCKGLGKTENSILSVLDRILYCFSPVEFPHGPLERKRAF